MRTETRHVNAVVMAVFGVALSVSAVYGQQGSPVFESGLYAATPASGHEHFNVDLHWKPHPNARSYEILRYQQLGAQPAVVARVPGTTYDAAVLPGKSFFFRVVAFSSETNKKGFALDTTTSLGVHPQNLFIDAATWYNDGVPITNWSCTVSPPGTLKLSWDPVPNASGYSVKLIHVNDANFQVIGTYVDTKTSTASFTQSGIPVGSYYIEVKAMYTLHDYPVPGQSTDAIAGLVKGRAAMPVTNSCTKLTP